MKKIFTLSSIFAIILLLFSCSSDDNETITPPEKQRLTITADHETILIGETVKFAVKFGNEIIEDATIKQINGEVLPAPEWKAEAIGTYNFIATKQGFEDSKSIAITVTKGKEKLTLVPSKTTVEIGEEVTFKAQAEGEEVTGFAVELIGKGKIADNKWTPTEIGKYSFKVTKEGYIESDPIDITVTEQEEGEAKGTGTFTYQDKAYPITKSILMLQGIGTSSNPAAGWVIKSMNLENSISIYTFFHTPAAEQEDGTYTYEMPNTENVSRIMVTIIDEKSQSVLELGLMGVEMKLNFDKVNSKNIVKGDLNIKIEDLNGYAFSLNYEGTHNFELASNE